MEQNPIIEDAFGHWFAGFSSGEGCFRIHSIRRGTYFGCTFSIKLRDDDSAILEEIQHTLQLGRVKPEKCRSGNSKPCVIWVVDTKRDCPGLVDIFERYPLRARKAQDFDLWKKAVRVWLSMDPKISGKGEMDWTSMVDLKRQIENVRRYTVQPVRHKASLVSGV